MRLNMYFLAAQSFCAAVSGQTTTDRVVYILHDEAKHSWCGYLNKEQWTSDLGRADADITGYLEYSQARLSQVNLREAAVTGDWVVDDKYTVSPKGELTELKRVISYYSENEQRRQQFDLREGKGKLVDSSIIDLKTGRPLEVPRLNSKFDTWPLFVRFTDFPFKALLRQVDKAQSTGVHCVSVASER